MILERLKRDTGKLHHELEARLDFLGRDWDRERYTRLLTAFAGFYSPVEKQLFWWIGLGILEDYEQRRKLPLLQMDLEELGVSQEAIPRAFAACYPQLPSIAAGLGTMYVLEGATLGGQYIRRHLHSLDPTLPLAFFSGYGSETGRMWQEFREAVTAFSAEQAGEADDEIVQAARETFSGLRDWLETSGVIA